MWMQRKAMPANELWRAANDPACRRIAVFDWERKDAPLMRAPHPLPFAFAHRARPHKALRAAADGGKRGL